MKLSEIKKYIKDRLKKGSPRNCDKLREQVAKMVAKMPNAAVPKHTVKKDLTARSGDRVYLIELPRAPGLFILKIFTKPERAAAEIPNTLIMSCIDKNMFSQVKMIGASFMILEYRTGVKTMFSIVEEAAKRGVDIRGPRFSKNMLEIIFQTYYALFYVSKFCKNYSHNDLSTKNILVYSLKSPIKFIINGKTYECKKYGVMIIDYRWALFTNKPSTRIRILSRSMLRFLKQYGFFKIFSYVPAKLKAKSMNSGDLSLLSYTVGSDETHSLNSFKCSIYKECLKHPIFDKLLKEH